MCLYPKLINNPKYRANKKNKGNIPEIKDKRVLLVPTGCGKCIECTKQKSRQWQVRLQEEIKTNTNGKFVTLTISNENYTKLSQEIKKLEGYDRDNAIAKLATRRFLERWRKKYKKSIRHWLITELGHNGTENIHLHGILFTENREEITKIWQYGYTWIGEYVNEKTINYITKYVTKTDIKHKEYQPKILTSAGIGSNYIQTYNATKNKYKPLQTKETYTTKQGIQLNLPIYYRNKIYTEEEREQLWLEKLNKEERYILGEKISTKDEDQYFKLLNWYRAKNKRLGYGDNQKNWEQKRYENEIRNLKHLERINKRKT